MSGTKYRNFGGSGLPFSRRPPMPRDECSFKGKKITSKDELDDYLSGESIQCLICGDYFASVSSHVNNKHGIPVKDYKEEFGIPKNTGIVIKSLKKIMSDNWKLVAAMDKRKQGTGNLDDEVDEFLKKRLLDFICFVNLCSDNKTSIYKKDANKTNKIHSFAKKYKDESLLSAIKENQKYSYDEKPSVESTCLNNGCNNKVKRFGSQSGAKGACCSYECSAEFKKSKRIEKSCAICGRVMLLTKGNYNRISTCCGKRSNSKADGSAINFK